MNTKYDDPTTEELLDVASVMDSRFKVSYISSEKVQDIKTRMMSEMKETARKVSRLYILMTWLAMFGLDVTYCNHMVLYLVVNCVFFYVSLIVCLLKDGTPSASTVWIYPATRRQSDHWAVCSKQIQAPLPLHLWCSWSMLLKLNLTAACCPPPLTVRQTLCQTAPGHLPTAEQTSLEVSLYTCH